MARIPRFLAGGLTAVMLTAAIGGAAYAQSAPTPVPGTPPAAVQQRATDFLNSLASKLGKTPAEVVAAFKAVQKEQVAQAVQEGRLTQQQADQANQRIDQATGLPFGGKGLGGVGGHHKGGGIAGPGRVAIDQTALATFFGVQPADLRATLQGKSLAQVAQEKGKSRDELKAFLTQQAKSQVDQAVQAGRLTQQQADQRMADLAARLDQSIDRVNPAAGVRGGRGGRGGQLPGIPGAPAAPAQPSA